MAKYIRYGKIEEYTVREDAPANNMGSGNIAIPEPPMFWDDKELQKRYRLDSEGNITLVAPEE